MRKISYKEYLDKVYGCFIGKAISGNIGAPHEGVKMPMELEFRQDMINPDLPNDDLDLQVLWLDVVEKKGYNFTSKDLLKQFCECCHYSPGEYAVMRKNYMRGIYPPVSGKFCNDYYTEGMGCPIRAEVWGCMAVGNMALASELSSRDGQLDHFGESIWAERFVAALESEAFFESDVNTLIDKALTVLPDDSKFRELVVYTRELCEKYADMKVVLTKLLFKYGHPDCTNMYQNMGITIASLLLGESDIIKTSLMALNCGFDTDCTCATAGAIIGLLRGADELIKAYGLKEVTYVLGVDSNRRSDNIFDLAEDIAKVGIEFTKSVNKDVEITDAPDVSFDFDKAPEFEFRAEYPDMMPSIALGETKEVTLVIKNNTNGEKTLRCSIDTVNGIIADKKEFDITVAAKDKCSTVVSFTLPESVDVVYDKNIFTLTASCEGKVAFEETFGLAGATPWKLTGPFWRCEPISNTELILEHFTEEKPYEALLPDSKVEGNFIDKLRHFHLNCATDTDTVFAEDDILFAPLKKDWANRYYETSIANVREDSIKAEQLFGFQGPCVFYLSRVVIAPCDMDVCIQVGHTMPFKLYFDGEMISERNYCDNWTAENVHIGKIRLKKGENKLAIRVTKVNADVKFNVTFTTELTLEEHIVSLGTKNPYKL